MPITIIAMGREAAGLAQVICPRCGAINDTRAPDYPFCSGCQDNLAKCGYCRWFDASTALCTHPIVSGIFEVDELATPPCVYHDPGDRLVVRRRVLRVAVWAAAIAAVAILVFGLVRLRTGGAAFPEQAALGLVVEADYQGAVVGEAYNVTAVLSNNSAAPVTGVRFEIAKRTLAAFDLITVMPRGGPVVDRGKWRVMSYPTLAPGESRRVVLILKPKTSGTLHVMVRLVSSGNIFHGLADLPVLVEEKPAAAPDTSAIGEVKQR